MQLSIRFLQIREVYLSDYREIIVYKVYFERAKLVFFKTKKHKNGS